MGSYDRLDLEFSDDGDLVVGSDGDLSVADIDQTTRQDIVVDTYTILNDFEVYPHRGSRLHTFIGEPNTRTNASLLQAEILRALTQGGYFSKSDLDIKVIPISIYNVVAYLTHHNSAGLSAEKIVLGYDYTKGIQVES
jgi:hypothetical protein